MQGQRGVDGLRDVFAGTRKSPRYQRWHFRFAVAAIYPKHGLLRKQTG